MRCLGIIIALLVAFGSLVPNHALAHPKSAASAHHMGKTHSSPPTDCTDCGGTCVGCAAPLKMAAAPEAPVIRVAKQRGQVAIVSLAHFAIHPELRPPRSIA